MEETKEVPGDGWKIKRDSFYKLLVYFTDGNSRTYYSIDWIYRFSKRRDMLVGIKRFKNMIERWGKRARVVIIYDVKTREEMTRFYKGEELRFPQYTKEPPQITKRNEKDQSAL